MAESPPRYNSTLDKGFDSDDIKKLIEYQLYAPSDVLKGVRNGTLDFDHYNANVAVIIKGLGRQNVILWQLKKIKKNNADKINELTNEIQLLQKYKDRIVLIPEGLKTIGTGIYTQKKRNAYEVNPQNGAYGNLMIDLPKLFGQLKIIAYKDGNKIYDKKSWFWYNWSAHKEVQQ